MNIHHHSFILVIAAITLIACSDSDDSDAGLSSEPSASQVSGMVNKIGFFDVANDTYNNEVDLTAIFVNTDSPVSAAAVATLNSLKAPSEDQCEVDLDAPDNGVYEIPGIGDDNSWTTLNAGEVLTLSSPAGSFAELQQSSPSNFYFTPNSLPGPAPAGLILDIPGSGFPAFAAVAVPEVEPFVLTSDFANEFMDISVDSTITWKAGSNPDRPIILNLNLLNSTQSIVADEQLRLLKIDCVLVDDGSFSFDQSTQTSLTEAGYDALPLSLGRKEVHLVQQGDTLLIVEQSSGNL